MCNAHNHPPNCNCNWGQGSNFSFSGRVSIYEKIIEKVNFSKKVIQEFIPGKLSITIPNALCPVCSKPVFFYQNNYGSRVFFDELGSPWPKHPCTDNSTYSTKSGKVLDIYAEKDYIIPKKNFDSFTSSTKNLLKRIFHNQFYKKGYKTLFEFQDKEYLLLDELDSHPDLMVLTKKGEDYFLETYEILTENQQAIKLLLKHNAKKEQLKFFEIDNNEILDIEILNSVYSTTEINQYSVRSIDYEITFIMNLDDFREENRKSIKFMKYLGNKDFNFFKVIYQNERLKEI